MRLFLLGAILCGCLFACNSSKTMVDDNLAAPTQAAQTVTEAIMPEKRQETKTIPGTTVEFGMTLIPGGSYMMGSESAEVNRREDEGPRVEVTVESFWMGTHEVSFDEYKIYRKKDLDLQPADMPDWSADAIARPSPPYEDPTFGMGENGYPAVSMTQLAALQYCKWLSDKSGEFYRLPTEAEWEYACKAGSESGQVDMIDDYAWHYDNSSEKYHKIGTKKANDWGLYDMLGNVSEWTMDQYTEDAYATISTKMAGEVNPWIKPTELHPRTVRGGSWDDDAAKARCSCRIKSSFKWKERDPQIPKSFWWNTDSPFVGFRLVKPANPPSPEEQAAFWDMVLGG